MFENLITSLPMLVCIFWSVLLWLDCNEQHSAAKMRLLYFTVACSMLYMGHYAYFNHLYHLLPITDTVYSFMNLGVFPLFYLYIKQMTDTNRSRRTPLTLLPSLIVGSAVALLYGMMDENETQDFIHNFLYRQEGTIEWSLVGMQTAVHYAAKPIFALQVIMTLTLGYRKITAYNKKVENCYADTEKRSLHAIKRILLLFIIASAASFIANIAGRNIFLKAPLLCIPSLMFSTLLFMLCYAGYKQNFNIDDLMKDNALPQPIPQKDEVADETVTNQRLTPQEDVSLVIAQLKEDIEAIMQKEQLYLQPDLRINDLARLLNTNRNYIYQVINVNMGMSFSEYINKQRTDYAVKLLKDDPSTSCTEIYVKAGFSSQASFFRNFKLYTGVSPKQYIKQLQKVQK